METRCLETLIAVADRGSVAAAARMQGIAATSVTQRLQALEAELGARLVTRVGREIKLTPAGEQILPTARGIVDEVRALTVVASNIPGGALAGTLRIGAISSAITGLLPPIIETWASDHPAVQLKIYPGSSAALHDGLEAGAYDVVIAVDPPFALSKVIRSHTLRVEPLICLVPADIKHLYSSSVTDQEEKILTILKTNRLIRYDALSWGGRLCEAYLRDKRVDVREFCSLDSLEAIALLVDRGVGVSLVPDWAPPWPTTPSCRKLEIADPTYARKIVLCHPAKTRFERIIHELARMLIP